MKIGIVGGGIVGLATAFNLQELNPGLELFILEKESDVGRHQSTHNSGVLHAGTYYKPGSLKARLSVAGIRRMTEFCRHHGIAHEICGKIILATRDEQLPGLKKLQDNAMANGLSGVRTLTREEILEREPGAGGVAALLVPEEGIVDYRAVCDTLASLIRAQNGAIFTNAELKKARYDEKKWHLETADQSFTADFLINCGGLQCDRVSELAGHRRPFRIVPFLGEYYKLKPSALHKVRHLIYPVPDPKFPFLGVHFTRLIHGGIEAGPNAVLAASREGYRRNAVNIRDFADSLSYPGLWRFLGKHLPMCVSELKRSFSRDLFCQSLQELVPSVQAHDLEPGGAGVRAQAMDHSGNLVQDFCIEEKPGVLHVLNAPSPAATASLEIGRYIATQAAESLSLPTKSQSE